MNKIQLNVLIVCLLVVLSCFADDSVESPNKLDQVLGSNRERQNFKLNTNDLALIDNIQGILNNSQKMADIMSLFGDKKCLDSLMSDSSKITGLVNILGKNPNPSTLMSDPTKMKEIMGLLNGNACFRQILTDQQKLQKLMGLVNDLGSLQSFQSVMNNKDKFPKLIELLQANRPVLERLASDQIPQIMNIFGDSCIKSLAANKDKLMGLMEIAGKTTDPTALLNNPQKLAEITKLFDGTDCSKILSDPEKLKKLTSMFSDLKSIDSLKLMLGAKMPKLNSNQEQQSQPRAMNDNNGNVPPYFNKNVPEIIQKYMDNKATGNRLGPENFNGKMPENFNGKMPGGMNPLMNPGKLDSENGAGRYSDLPFMEEWKLKWPEFD